MLRKLTTLAMAIGSIEAIRIEAETTKVEPTSVANTGRMHIDAISLIKDENKKP